MSIPCAAPGLPVHTSVTDISQTAKFVRCWSFWIVWSSSLAQVCGLGFGGVRANSEVIRFSGSELFDQPILGLRDWRPLVHYTTQF